jgi:ADP-ribosylation factor protein 1
MRQLWRHYYEGAVAVIFVVDSSDTERLGEAAFELEQMGSDEVKASRACGVLFTCLKQESARLDAFGAGEQARFASCC